YKAQADDLHAGRTPRIQSDGLTVADRYNRFLSPSSIAHVPHLPGNGFPQAGTFLVKGEHPANAAQPAPIGPTRRQQSCYQITGRQRKPSPFRPVGKPLASPVAVLGPMPGGE